MGVICKYKYDSSIYADLIPTFNSGYSGYVITDEVEENIITRTIESSSLPTLMRFGRIWVEGESSTDNRTDSLLEVLDMNTRELTSCFSMFRYCKNLTSISCEWNTSNVTNMYCMFHNCTNLTSLNVSNWNTSNVSNMYGTFSGCINLTSLDVSNFDTSNVDSMSHMFYNCNNLTSLDVSNWNTSNVTSMESMFDECNVLTSLDVSNWDTSKVVDINHMFYNCKLLTSLDVSNWDTSKVTNMQQVFDICYVLNIDVSNWDTSNVTNMYAMFGDCRMLSSLDLTKWDTSKVTNMLGVYWGCNNLVELNISSWDTSNVTNMRRMFYECTKLTTLDISNFNTSNVTNTADMFVNSNSLEVITMLNSDINTINTIGNLTSATIYVDESLDQSQYTGTAPLKVYKEEKLEIKLSSPLLEEDTIEVVDGKICHVHRYGKVVLDGSENWQSHMSISSWFYVDDILTNSLLTWTTKNVISNDYRSIKYNEINSIKNKEICYGSPNGFTKRLIFKDEQSNNLEEWKQWLSEKPTTVVYPLEIPYYEDITPLQSSLVLKTFLESSMTIDTNLPIETKLSYRTNVPSISTLSTRATELAESDNVIHNLMNIIDDEVDE